MRFLRYLAVLSLLFAQCVFARADSLAELSDSFWQWRAQEQPFSDDDIPRIERPAGLVVDWSPQTITNRLQQLDVFEQRWKALAPSAQTPIHDQVDYRLLGSAVARVRWELSIEQSWKRNPQFYVDQTLGSVVILLLPPPPFSEARQQEIVARVKQIPATLQTAQENLTDLRQPFVQLAIDSLDQVADRLQRTEKALAPQLTAANNQALQQATPAAATALTQYRAWLTSKLATRAQRHRHWTRQLHILPEQSSAASLHTRAVAGDEPPGVEQSGRLRNLPAGSSCWPSTCALLSQCGGTDPSRKNR